MISFLISLLVVCIVFSAALYILNQLGPPAPYGNIARVLLAVIFLVVLLRFLLPLGGYHGWAWG